MQNRNEIDSIISFELSVDQEHVLNGKMINVPIAGYWDKYLIEISPGNRKLSIQLDNLENTIDTVINIPTYDQIFVTQEYSITTKKHNNPRVQEFILKEESISNLDLFVDSLFESGVVSLDDSELFPVGSKSKILLRSSKEKK